MKSISRGAVWLTAAHLVLSISHAPCAAVTLTMDDLPNQSVAGLVHPAGVTFGFTIGGNSSSDARYGAGGPGQLTYIQDPSIEGSTNGVLAMTFLTPTPVLQFGIARNQLVTAIPNGATVNIFDAANASLGTFTVALTPVTRFVEGKFSYIGTPVKRALLSFASGVPNRFVLDNLVFAVPEPVTATLVVPLALACAGISRRRAGARNSRSLLAGPPRGPGSRRA